MTDNASSPPESRPSPASVWLFSLTGAALPFYAFPPVRAGDKAVDFATLFAALFVLSRLVRRENPARPYAAWLGAACLVPLTVLVGTAADAVTFSLRQYAWSYLHWLLVVVFFVLAAKLEMSRRDWTLFVRLQVGVGLVVAGFCFYQVIGREHGWPATGAVIASWQREPFDGGSFGGYERPTSFLLEPSYLGGYLGWLIALPLSIAVAGGSLRTASRAAHAVAAAILATAIFASASLGAWIDFAGSVCVLAVHAVFRLDRRRSRAPVALGALGVVLLLVVADAMLGGGPSSAIATRLRRDIQHLRGGDYAALGTYRLGLHVREAQVAASHPLTGVGLGQYRSFSPTVAGEFPGSEHVVSGWIGSAAEMGFPGLAVLAAAVLLARRRSPSLTVALITAYLVLNQLHAAGYLELTFWYPLAVCAIAARPPANGLE